MKSILHARGLLKAFAARTPPPSVVAAKNAFANQAIVVIRGPVSASPQLVDGVKSSEHARGPLIPSARSSPPPSVVASKNAFPHKSRGNPFLTLVVQSITELADPHVNRWRASS